MSKKAVVLVSGGLDSATVLAMAKDQGYTCYALSMDYGQRHRIELDRARKVALANGAAEHRVVRIDIGNFGGSALTDQDLAVPTQASTEIPITYVPARNTVFLSVALGWAEVLGAQAIFIGANAVDYSGYPDCRPEYIAAFQAMANLATKTGVNGETIRIEAPIIDLTKADIIKAGTTLGVDYSHTISCYNPRTDGKVCGECDSCRIRAAGFAATGVPDPALI
ncbi:7-cyano-7-deazaguanine synthase [Arenicella chitinivorans]|uniref:7-cyano-7-deazaguanine synthase n=1 Tax=Arenicella chitinivorans TaxID=1329800 RepID=A0A918RUZ4_9GAMM|nr:7-cyano-7-deazaguanine synthase QueC [Arenicella chitinivorans]GHA11970.1 7-cyano-7-deazaguanine synthase [Arenicella chitinivorans]